MAWEVREARPGEEDQVLAMYEWLFAPPGSEPPGWDPEAARPRLTAALEADDAGVLVADETGALLGLCSVYIDLESIRYGRRCWIEDLAVDPAQRSRGVGRGLMDAAKAWARERGATHVELDSGSARVDAHRFYEREGPSWTGMQYSWWLE
jgi:GNAT superfamily N-acetyltransferase